MIFSINITKFKNSEEASKTDLFLPAHMLLSDKEILFIRKILNLLLI